MKRDAERKTLERLATVSLHLTEQALPALAALEALRDRSLAIRTEIQALSVLEPVDGDSLRGAMQRLSNAGF